MSLDISVPGAYSNVDVSFTAASGTAAKILVDESPAGGLTNNFLANAALTGGVRIVDSTVSSTDGSDKDLIVYDGTRLTAVGGATGTVTITTQNTINRPNGSWLADGWRVGATVMPFAALNAAPQLSDGIAGVVTSVTATTLVVSGTPFTNETLVAGTRLCRVSQQFKTKITANSGNTNALLNVSLIANGMDSTADRQGVWLGAAGLKIVAPATAVSALPAIISVNAKLAGY